MKFYYLLLIILISGTFFVPSIFAQTPGLYVDEITYQKLKGQDTVAKFFGYVDDGEKGGRILLTVTSPSGDISENRIHPSNTGYFELFYSLNKSSEIGVYSASAIYLGESIGTTSFDLIDNGNYFLKTENIHNDDKSTIPSWVKNMFIWYGDDMISENELLSAIQFLVNEKIIILN